MSSKLLEFSKGGGCGCKIDPLKLRSILSELQSDDKDLLIGFGDKDDAVVFEINPEQCIIQTVDFFLPLVNNPYDFGMIAAANAISDVYAMGGKPIMASSLLGWPTENLSLELAREVLRGAEMMCKEAGIHISGGHSIETTEPIFGLTVNGLIEKKFLKRKTTCREGDLLYITKPLGLGLLANANKHGQLSEQGYKILIDISKTLNKIGIELGQMEQINAMTDITGFGLLGHLSEMLGETFGARLYLDQIPVINEAQKIAENMLYPNITTGNYNFVKDRCDGLNGLEFLVLCDPQTSGGLMFTSSKPLEMNGVYLIGNITSSGRIQII